MTIGGSSGSVKVLEPPIGRDLAAVWPRQRQLSVPSRAHLAGDRHSRRVVFLKHVLPVIGATMLVLVALWPRLGTLLENVGLGFSAIDLHEARELRMLNPRYAGIDQFDRPYVITSTVGRQVPNRDDLMSLERPKAEMTMHGGAIVVLTATTAIYQSQAQRLDLSGDVTLVHENGTRFVTKSAHADVSANTADGHDPVSGDGPSGKIVAQGFRILDKGDTIIFAGKSNLLLKGAKPAAPRAAPPALPAEIEAMAARIEAAATLSSAGVSEPSVPGNLIAEPVRVVPAKEPVAPAKARGR